MSTTNSYTFSSLWFCTTATSSWTTKRREPFELSPRKETLRSGSASAARGGSPHPAERSPEEKRVLRVKFKKESLRSGSAPRQGVGAPTPTSGPPKRSRPSLRNEKNFAFYLHMNLESSGLHVTSPPVISLLVMPPSWLVAYDAKRGNLRSG